MNFIAEASPKIRGERAVSLHSPSLNCSSVLQSTLGSLVGSVNADTSRGSISKICNPRVLLQSRTNVHTKITACQLDTERGCSFTQK